MRAIYLALTLAAIFAIPKASAEPHKAQYALQERCGKRAAEVFKSDYGSGGITNTQDGQQNTTYENHYSVTINKCFLLEILAHINDKRIS
jgi:hypothetical protein